MGATLNDPSVITRLLDARGRWAVVGLSANPGRDSHRIAALLIDHGMDVVGVNPALEGAGVLGVASYGSLADVPVAPEVVDVFRRSEAAGAVVDEAIACGAGAVWLQLGVVDEAAAARAVAAGVDVVMDRCPAIELARRGV